VVVLINGRPLSTRWTTEHVPALVEAWEPGERGGEAVADVLFGNYNPTGRLAISVPRHSGQLPVYYNYKPSKAARMQQGYVDMPATPLYPFGNGMSYTKFEYSNLHVEPAEIHPGGEARVTLDVKNTGQRTGTDVVQVYVGEKSCPLPRPLRELKGFHRATLDPGETQRVEITLPADAFAYYDPAKHDWTADAGHTFTIEVGQSEHDIKLTDKIVYR